MKNTIYIAICDDNPLVVEELNSLLLMYIRKHKYKNIEIHRFTSGEALLKSSTDYGIIFLDIEMPGVNGIYIGNKISNIYPHTIIIVTTSYMEYLDDAMRFNVFRYISKPIDKNRLFRNLDDAFIKYYSVNESIVVKVGDSSKSIALRDIVYLEVIVKEVHIHTVDDDIIPSDKFEKLAALINNPTFYRPHRSFIINMAYVSRFTDSLIYLLGETHTAYLTRRKYVDFRKNYLAYLESTNGGNR